MTFSFTKVLNFTNLTRMWADVQRDGCAAKYMLRPLLNARKFGWCQLLERHAV